MLIHLSHAELFDEQFLHVLQLINLVVHFIHTVILLGHLLIVELALLVLNLTLRLVLHGNKLARASVDLIPLRPLPEVFVLLVSYAALEQLLLLCHENALHAQRALLLL